MIFHQGLCPQGKIRCWAQWLWIRWTTRAQLPVWPRRSPTSPKATTSNNSESNTLRTTTQSMTTICNSNRTRLINRPVKLTEIRCTARRDNAHPSRSTRKMPKNTIIRCSVETRSVISSTASNRMRMAESCKLRQLRATTLSTDGPLRRPSNSTRWTEVRVRNTNKWPISSRAWAPRRLRSFRKSKFSILIRRKARLSYDL